MNYEETIENIQRKLKSYIANNIKSFALRVSGEIDSCLCAVIVKSLCDELNMLFISRSLLIITRTQDEINR